MNATGNFKKAITVESLLKEPETQKKPGKKLTAEEQEAIQRRFGGK